MKRLSVVVPAFNAEKTLRRTLESLSKQSLKGMEVILVDDASTDKTPLIAKSFPKVKYFRQEKLGASAARNRGARKASGKIVAFLDSDVAVEGKWAKKILEEFESNPALFGASGRLSSQKDGSLSSDFFALTVSSSSFQAYNSAFRRKEFLELGGFNEGFPYGAEEADLSLKAVEAGKKLGFSGAGSVHRAEGLAERLKRNLRYSFFDGFFFRKNFFPILQNLGKISCSNSGILKYSIAFYSVSFLSYTLLALGSFLVSPVFLFLFLAPGAAGAFKAFKESKHLKFRNNVFAVAAYAFFAVSLFAFLKAGAFLAGAVFKW